MSPSTEVEETGRSGDPAARLREVHAVVSRFEPGWRHYVVSGALAAASSLSEAATLVLLTVTAAAVAAGERTSDAVVGFTLERSEMLAAAAGLLVARLVLSFVYARYVATISARTALEARSQLVESFTSADWETQSRQQQGLFFDLVANRADVVGYSAMLLVGVVTATMNLLVLAVAALVLQPLAVVALALVGAAITFGLRPLNRRTRAVSLELLGENEAFLNAAGDMVHVARDMTAYGVGPRFAERLTQRLRRVAELHRARGVLVQLVPQVYQTVGLGLAVTGLAVASAVGGADLAALGAVVLLLLRGTSYGQTLMTTINAANDRMPTIVSVVDALDGFARLRRQPGDTIPQPPHDLRLDGVTYRYDTEPVVNELTLAVPAGQRLGIVGPSGGGKSTLLQLLAGLRRPDAGSMAVGGVPLDECDPSWWASQMAIVPQDARLLDGTVQDNVSFLRDISDADTADAASRAQLGDEIEAFGGFGGRLSREGRNISGGQLQRLAIARALAGDPSVLLLDEPTSALDTETEQRLHQALLDVPVGTTLVIVAHRLSTVTGCDRIIVVRDGRIVDDGPPGTILGPAARWRSEDLGLVADSDRAASE